MKQTKIIYSKRIKELLIDEYGIHPIARVRHQWDRRLYSWIFEQTSELSSALQDIRDKDGKKNGPDSQDKQKH